VPQMLCMTMGMVCLTMPEITTEYSVIFLWSEISGQSHLDNQLLDEVATAIKHGSIHSCIR